MIFHSDRGSQYASQAMSARLVEYGMTASMSRKGHCWDNAPSESFFNSLKNERVHGTSYATRADAEADLFQYIEVFYNRSRRHSTLGWATARRFGTFRTGSASMQFSNLRRHEAGCLEDEIRGAPQKWK